jgi:hypothetical protein
MGKNVNSLTVDVVSQHNTDGGTNNVTLFGGAPLTQKTGAIYETTFNVTPLVSRIEISANAIKGVVSTDQSKSITFRLKGIFIDNYYSEINIDGTFDNANLVSNGTAPEMYRLDGNNPSNLAKSSYTSVTKGAVFDFAGTGPLDPPASGNVWAYNMLTTNKDGAALPTIVIYMTQVYVDGTRVDGDFYLTINKYYKDGNRATPFNKLTPGVVYGISSIKFTEKDIAPAPYATSKNAVMNVNVMKWARENTGVGFIK